MDFKLIISAVLASLAFGAILLLAVWLAKLPGKIARRRGHASADAVNICGLLGLLLWPCWIVAIIWAHAGPDNSPKPAQQKAPPAQPPAGYKGSKSMNFPG